MFFSQFFQSAKSSEANDNMSSRLSSDSWIARQEERCFKESHSYCGVVECIQSRITATVIVAQKKNGKPLMWHEVWDPRKDQFGRVLLLVNRLHSSINGEAYKKDMPIDTVLQEGDLVMVELKQSALSPDNTYNYFANSAYKNTGSFGDLSKISDPLRGVVDSMLMEAAIVRFGTYVGGVAKCVLTIHNLYYKGEKVKQNIPMGAVISVGTQIYLEVTKWSPVELKQEWEKVLYKEGVIFRATKAWMKGDPRPIKRASASEQERSKVIPSNESPASSLKHERHEGARRSGNEKPGGSLTSLQAYYGVVEAITSSVAAVVCTAHRNGESLSWRENWLARGVMVERALLLVDHIRPSKTEPEYMKGTDIRKILDVGDPLMIVVESSDRKPDKCYRWFVRTSWKVGKEEKESCTVFHNALPGHLHGIVDCLLTHSIGIIAFNTFHGMSAKAFFTHNNFYQNGEKIMDHLPLGSEIRRGTEVLFIAERWNPGRNPSATDQEMIEKQVRFRATLVWLRGTPKPKEGGSSNAKKSRMPHVGEHQKHGFQENPHSEKFKKNEESRGGGGRGRRGGNPRSRGRGRQRRSGSRSGSGKDTGDSVGNCSDDSDSNFSDISSMSDYFGAMKFEKDDSSASFHSVGGPSKSELCHTFYEEHTNLPVTGLNGSIVSIDEDWGLVQVNDDEMHDFKPNNVLLYGLKLDNIPLNRLLRQGQVVKVCLKGGKISVVEYGAPQLPNQMRKAIHTYCDKNSVPYDVKEILEKTMLRYGV